MERKEISEMLWIITVLLSVITGFIIFLFLIAFALSAPTAYYQSKITGYSFWECFWAGNTIKTVQVDKK